MLRNGEDAKWGNQRAAPSEVDLKQGLRGPSGEAERALIISCRRRPQRRVSDATPRRAEPNRPAPRRTALRYAALPAARGRRRGRERERTSRLSYQSNFPFFERL